MRNETLQSVWTGSDKTWKGASPLNSIATLSRPTPRFSPLPHLNIYLLFLFFFFDWEFAGWGAEYGPLI